MRQYRHPWRCRPRAASSHTASARPQVSQSHCNRPCSKTQPHRCPARQFCPTSCNHTRQPSYAWQALRGQRFVANGSRLQLETTGHVANCQLQQTPRHALWPSNAMASDAPDESPYLVIYPQGPRWPLAYKADETLWCQHPQWAGQSVRP